MNTGYHFTHKKVPYIVNWEEDSKVLKLSFETESEILFTKDVKLLGVIDQNQLDQLVIDYWNWFKNKYLKDIS